MSLPSLPTRRSELLQAGVPRTQLDTQLRDGRAHAPFRGVLVQGAHSTSYLIRVHAALATQKTAVYVGMQSAAVLLGLRWLPAAWAAPDATVHLVVRPTDAHRHRAGLRLHRRTVAAHDTVVVQGVLCLSVARTLVELARDPGLQECLVIQIIDGALYDKRVSLDELAACLAQFPGERYMARARRLVSRAREGVASPPETTVRLILEDGGIHVETNLEISDHDGLLLAAGDFGIRRYLLWGEYDGFDPHSQRRAFRGDRVGDRWLTRRGWQPMRFVDVDLSRPASLCSEWHQAIADAPARIAALDPRRSPEVAEAQRLLGLCP